MNYKRIYDQIIERAIDRKLEGYVERHHIIPRSKGGSDDPSNLVELTAREHLLCHWLLARHTGNYKDWWAFKAMCTLSTKDQKRTKPSLRMIAEIRENAHNHSEYIKKNKKWNTGRKHTEETKAKMRADWASNPNRNYWTKEKRKKRSEQLKARLKGKPIYDVTGHKHMNNGVVSKMVSPEKIEEHLKNGFKFGRLKKNS